MTGFNPSAAALRIANLWELDAEFGLERGPYHVYLNEIVSDRYALVKGLQLLRDELQFAAIRNKATQGDIVACGADFTLASVVTTLASTNCGDRIHQGAATTTYANAIATRFATISEVGDLKVEAFSPTGGGTDDGATLAHVTVAHQLDDTLRRLLYSGNKQSYYLVNVDLKTHVGRLDEDGRTTFGKTRESPFREPRAACGAVVGALTAFNPSNGVHARIKRDLGDDNHAFLAKNKILTSEGYDATAAVASSIVAVRGLLNTAHACAHEMDERGVAHLTASVTVNRPSQDDTIVYLARSTVFNGEIRTQGFGTDARKYAAAIVDHPGDTRLLLTYDGQPRAGFPVATEKYAPRRGAFHTDVLD